MFSESWISINYLSPSEFSKYLDTLSDDEKNEELARYSKRHANSILKDEIKKHTCFYSFIKSYSPRDYKLIRKVPHVSQRVVITHVKFWNDVHPEKKIKKLRVFFY
jgi:predicted nuclease of restriction endonuclease-like RecB superfamily